MFQDSARFMFPNNPSFFFYWKINSREVTFQSSCWSRPVKKKGKESKLTRQNSLFNNKSNFKFSVQIALYYIDILNFLTKLVLQKERTTSEQENLNLSQQIFSKLQTCESNESFRTEVSEELTSLASSVREYVLNQPQKDARMDFPMNQKFIKNFHICVDFGDEEFESPENSHFKSTNRFKKNKNILSLLKRQYKNTRFSNRNLYLLKDIGNIFLSVNGEIRPH